MGLKFVMKERMSLSKFVIEILLGELTYLASFYLTLTWIHKDDLKNERKRWRFWIKDHNSNLEYIINIQLINALLE